MSKFIAQFTVMFLISYFLYPFLSQRFDINPRVLQIITLLIAFYTAKEITNYPD